MPSPGEPKLGTLSTLSIGIGGMVGGGIFAITGLTIEVTRGSAPIAFVIAGIVALLTSYSYLQLTLRYPGEGGTVDFLNRGFGGGILTGAANILLLLSYVVLLAAYAYAFGSYGSRLLPSAHPELWTHALTTGVILGLVLINVFAARLVIRRARRALRQGRREPGDPPPPVDSGRDDRALADHRDCLPRSDRPNHPAAPQACRARSRGRFGIWGIGT